MRLRAASEASRQRKRTPSPVCVPLVTLDFFLGPSLEFPGHWSQRFDARATEAPSQEAGAGTLAPPNKETA
jgi:hypothetical protein